MAQIPSETDFVVVGGGIAGLRAAIGLAEAGRVLVVTKQEVTESNTQYAQGMPILGTLHGGVLAPVFLTLTESAAITIVVTGSSYTTGAASDVKLAFFEVNAMN